jgi:hypothetical protein
MSRASNATILILALEPDAAAQISYRAHTVGFLAFAPREDETALEAAFRLHPSVILIQLGRPELDDSSIEPIAKALNASLVVFGDETPELHRIAEAHGGQTVSINASRREFGSVMEKASGA